MSMLSGFKHSSPVRGLFPARFAFRFFMKISERETYRTTRVNPAPPPLSPAAVAGPEIDCFFWPRFAVSFGSSLAFFIFTAPSSRITQADVDAQWRTSQEITGFVLASVLTRLLF